MKHYILDIEMTGLDSRDIPNLFLLKGCIFTINANIVVNALNNLEYREILKSSTINVCDGKVLAFILSILTRKKLRPLPGPDLFISMVKNENCKHGFLGSSLAVRRGLYTELSKFNAKIRERDFIELPFCDIDSFDFYNIAEIIEGESFQVVWVSLGAPKQEIFAYKLSKLVPNTLIIPVGAAFDFYSGSEDISRAPSIMRYFGLEWLYRLIKQPKKTMKRLIQEVKLLPIIILRGLYSYE